MKDEFRNLFYEQLQQQSDTDIKEVNKRTIIVILETDTDETIKQIRTDIENEISCCYNTFNVREIEEVFDWYEYC